MLPSTPPRTAWNPAVAVTRTRVLGRYGQWLGGEGAGEGYDGIWRDGEGGWRMVEGGCWGMLGGGGGYGRLWEVGGEAEDGDGGI